jgi:fructose-1-phosphate kinase PfkB-like protein
MGERLNLIESVLRRIEEHVARWREEMRAREAEVEADQDKLWAEAAERERLLAETIEGEESQQRAAGEICQEQRVVFVIHSQEAKEALEGLSREGVRLARVIPAEEVSRGGAGLESSWLLFE